MSAKYEVRGEIAVITLDNPPLNGLGHATRVALLDGLRRAHADAAVRAIVLCGAGRSFSSGADIKEFAAGTVFAEPNLLTVIAAVEDATKPVIAALHGVAMGGGLELALACHARIAAPGCDLALPEVKLGLIPGAGGTQRLPRTLGVEAALNLIVSGETVKSERLAQLPGQQLLDRLSASVDSLPAEALALAGEFAARHAEGTPPPRVSERPCAHPQGEAWFQFARTMVKTQAGVYPAPLRALESIENATRLSFNDGLAKELEIFLALLHSPESRALRHLFMAERAAGKLPPDLPADTPPRPVHKVGVVGAGLMGSGIAINFLDAGLPVTLLDRDEAAIARGVATIRKHYEGRVAKGKLDAAKAEARGTLLDTALDYAALADADLVIEAVFEDMAVKQEVFHRLDAVLKPGALLASNTSTLDLDALAAVTARPQDVVGLHFFSPAQVMKLLEVVRGAQTAPEVLATALAVGKQIRKTCVVAGVCDGFIGNRMIEQFGRQAGFLLDEGCSPQQIDRALENFGFAMGPFRMSDLAGNDLSWHIRQRHRATKPDYRASASGDRLYELGRHGQKSGAGWYDYPAGSRDPQPSAVVAEMLDAHRARLGIAPRQIDDEEIVQRLVFALVNEAAHILAEGIANKASDIDVVYVFGYGFPPQRGGPLHYADQFGLARVVAAMQRFARNPHDDADFWQPAPLLAELAARHRTFNA